MIGRGARGGRVLGIAEGVACQLPTWTRSTERIARPRRVGSAFATGRILRT
ncbi:hypothetical protein ACWCQW_52410 [Streptomyces mirabilis]